MQSSKPHKHQSTKPSEDFGSQTPYLINTGRAVHGHKLKMRDLLKIQLLKGRRCSPSKSENQIIQEMEEPKLTEYSDKYRGFDTIEDEEALYRFLSGQKHKNSKHASNRMKMFTQREIKTARDDRSSTFRTINTPRDTHTSQTHRAPYSHRTPATPGSSIKHYTTISYENSPTYEEPVTTHRGVEFVSDNLGKRMNEYMNLVLQKKEKGEIQIREEELKEEAVLMRIRQSQMHQHRAILAQHKRKSNNFFRQMKKHLKQQYSQRSEEPALRDKMLVKSLVQRTQTNIVDRKHSKITSQTAHFRTLDSKLHPNPKYTIPHPSYTERQNLFKTLEEIVSVPSSKR